MDLPRETPKPETALAMPALSLAGPGRLGTWRGTTEVRSAAETQWWGKAGEKGRGRRAVSLADPHTVGRACAPEVWAHRMADRCAEPTLTFISCAATGLTQFSGQRCS